MKLFFFKFKIENFTKTKKTSSYIHPRNIPTDLKKNPNNGCRVTGVDRQTDRLTDRRRTTAIGPVDLKTGRRWDQTMKNNHAGSLSRKQDSQCITHLNDLMYIYCI